MSVVKLPFVLERFDVVAYEDALGVRLCQLESGAACVLSFHRVGLRGDEPGPVEASGRVQVGDALLCVDECPIELLKFDEVLRRLKELQRPLTLTFGRTEAHVREEVESRARAAEAKARGAGEQARLLELEAERHERRQRQAARDGGGARAAASAAPAAPARALYTSKDFDGRRLRPVHKLALGLAGLMALMLAGFVLDVDVFDLTSVFSYSESGKEEVYHSHAADKAALKEQRETALELAIAADHAAADTAAAGAGAGAGASAGAAARPVGQRRIRPKRRKGPQAGGGPGGRKVNRPGLGNKRMSKAP